MVQASFDSQLIELAPFIFYLIAFVVMYVENGIMLGFFLPGDSLLFSAGLVAAANPSIDISLLCVVVFLGAFIGDQTGYVIGRKYGRPYIDRKNSPKLQRMIIRAEKFYDRSGWWAVVAARYFPWIRTFVPPIAGASKMRYYSFLTANAFGALSWAVLITLAGYYSASIPWVKSSSYAIAAFFITASIISSVAGYLRHRR
ncbi:MAG: DedA family protein [Candidatus Nanopelagicaceae bacterium]|jgi:membrane-associated protein|nr:DedA family protein [Candidatus Nanopelagicaceae bacterium]